MSNFSKKHYVVFYGPYRTSIYSFKRIDAINEFHRFYPHASRFFPKRLSIGVIPFSCDSSASRVINIVPFKPIIIL